MSIVPLRDASDRSQYGGKAVHLSESVRAGLPVPAGLAISCAAAERIAAGHAGAVRLLLSELAALKLPVAVRSSAAGEDGTDRSYAGIFKTVLNAADTEGILSAVREVCSSAYGSRSIAYRDAGFGGADVDAHTSANACVNVDADDSLNIEMDAGPDMEAAKTRPRMAVIVQEMTEADIAGVLFTRHPVTGEDLRLVEAGWGLGESVVAGRMIPDRYSFQRGRAFAVQADLGSKETAIRPLPGGGTMETEVAAADRRRYCLTADRLQALDELAGACERLYGPALDIEWAYAGDKLFLLQCRPITI